VKLNVPEELNHNEKCKNLNIYKKGTVTIAEISTDLDRLLNFGEYAMATAHLAGPDTALHVSLQLTRFPVLDSLEINGNNSVPINDIMSVLLISKNKALHSDSLRKSLQAITQLYRDRGYSLMNINETRLDLKSGYLSLDIDEGIIDTIRVEGNKKTKTFVISREFTLRQGDVFNWRKVHQSVQNIYATQLFDRVNVDIVPEGNRTALLIKVEEKSSVRMRIGGKIDNERRAQSYIEFGDDNFTSTGTKASIITRLGLRDGLLGLNIRDNRIFKTFLSFTLQGYYSWQVNHIAGNGQSGRYRENRIGTRLQIGQQLRRIGQLSAELRLESVEDKTYSGNFSLEKELELRTFALRSITDKRDRIDFPTKGIYNNWVWETGSQFLLNSQISYTKAAVNLEDYYTLRENHTWHLRFKAGVGDEAVPFSETYRLGGLHSFFGLLENQFYGRQIVLMNSEYRLKLPVHLMNGVYLGGRFDFGGIWEQPELLFDAEDFFSGAGIYLAVDTLFGPLYMAYGQMTEGRSATYLSLGFNF
jgi:outer membrane protein assembly factor BamA